MAYYGAGLFNFTILHNLTNASSITSVLGLNDGKLCTLYIDTITVTLHRVLQQHIVSPTFSQSKVYQSCNSPLSASYNAHTPHHYWETTDIDHSPKWPFTLAITYCMRLNLVVKLLITLESG